MLLHNQIHDARQRAAVSGHDGIEWPAMPAAENAWIRQSEHWQTKKEHAMRFLLIGIVMVVLYSALRSDQTDTRLASSTHCVNAKHVATAHDVAVDVASAKDVAAQGDSANDVPVRDISWPPHLEVDLLVVGGTESGWAATIQAARLGVGSIALVLDGDWLGGQFTEQGLACVDENKGVGRVGWGVDWHPMKRSFHRSGLFKELMDRIESENIARYGDPMPGRPYHGPSTFRPAEAEAIFLAMLQPYIDTGQVALIRRQIPTQVDLEIRDDETHVTGVWFRETDAGEPALHVSAQVTIDATDWGEVIQLSGAAFECGPDPQSRYGEPSAPSDASTIRANEMNPITWAMIVEQSDDSTPIPRPPRYDDRCFVRTSRLSLDAMRDLNWDRPVSLGSIPHWPAAGAESPRQLSVYNVRRLIDGNRSRQGRTVILLNYMLGQDYPLVRLPEHVAQALEATEQGASTKNIVQMSREQRQIIFDDAKRHSLCLLYHLQNLVHEAAHDQTNSFRSFHLSDEFETVDHLPPKPYIRESLRLKAMYMMREQDARNTDGTAKESAQERFAQVMYYDGVLAWQFHYDFHRTGRAYLSDAGESGPWIDFETPGRHTRHVSDRSMMPLRSLLPIRVNGLIGAQKNLGYSSIVSAAIRLHDQCVAVGQVAGATAFVALLENVSVRSIPYDRAMLERVRKGVCFEHADHVPLLIWPYRDLSPDQEGFVAINRLSALGVLPMEATDVDFRPDELADQRWRDDVVDRTRSLMSHPIRFDAPRDEMTRAQFCSAWWSMISTLPRKPFVRQWPDDADRDGILDVDDPLPFVWNEPVEWKVSAPSAEHDGIPAPIPAESEFDLVRQFNFGPETVALEGFEADWGMVYRDDTGFGWSADMTNNQRQRHVFGEQARDTFVFTRERALWECEVPNGQWRVTVCVGDASYPQDGQRLSIESESVIENAHTGASRYLEVATLVEVEDGRISVELGPQQPSQNTCINWLRIERPIGHLPRD